MSEAAYQGFIEPDGTLADIPFETLHAHLGIGIQSGHRAYLAPFAEEDPAFAELLSRITLQAGYEDQCSAKYYYDMHKIVAGEATQIDRIVEVGVFMGGASVILAGLVAQSGAELVLIDIVDRHLQFSYQRLIRDFPSIAGQVRLFHGDLPTYIRDVLVPEQSASRIMIQLDGGHGFQDVIRDLGTLSYVQDRLIGVMAQDTHLRGVPNGARFIDAALYSVFGGDFQYLAMGAEYSALQHDLVTPNQYGGNYFLPGKPEGMYLPMTHNAFEYPHPEITIDQFFW